MKPLEVGLVPTYASQEEQWCIPMFVTWPSVARYPLIDKQKQVYHYKKMSAQELARNVVYDPEVKGYIMYDATACIPELPSITIDGVEVFPKEEYHVSLVAARKAAQQNPEQEAAIVRLVSEYLRRPGNALEWDGLTGEYYLCHKLNEQGEMQFTVVAGAAIIGLEGLQRMLRHHFSIPPSQPHVTLLKSANSPYGIGVNSADDLANYCELRPDIAPKLQILR